MVLKVLYDPDSFFKSTDVSLIQAIAVVLLSGLVGSLAVYVKLPELEAQILESLVKTIPADQAKLFLEFFRIQMIISPFIGVFISWIFMSAVLYGLSALFGGSGDFSKLFKFTAFGFLPSIVLSPLTAYTMSLKPTIPYIILGWATNLWQAFILVFALKHARNLRLRNAVICVAIPYVVMFILGIVGITMFWR